MKPVIVADSSFVIALVNPNDLHHAPVVAWLKEIEHRHCTVYLPVIALAEFALQGDFDLLMQMGDFLPVEFSQDDALETGRIFDAREKLKSAKETPTDRIRLKDDLKILATAKRVKATHLLTTDEQMARIADKLEICRVIRTSGAVDKSFFNKDGQHEIPLEGLPESPSAAARKKTTKG